MAKVEQLTAAFRTGSTQDLVDSWVKAAKAAENSGNVRGCFWAELIAPQKKSVYQAGLVVGGLSDTEHATVVDTTLYFEIDGRLFMFGDDGKYIGVDPGAFPTNGEAIKGPVRLQDHAPDGLSTAEVSQGQNPHAWMSKFASQWKAGLTRLFNRESTTGQPQPPTPPVLVLPMAPPMESSASAQDFPAKEPTASVSETGPTGDEISVGSGLSC